MARRTTILLTDECREATREIARRQGCSAAEAIRRAILRYRDLTAGVPPERRRERVEALRRLVDLSRGQDAPEEIERLKAEDEGF